jgi:hypothetical protein
MAIKPTVVADKNGNWKLSTVIGIPVDASGNTDAGVFGARQAAPDAFYARHVTAVSELK